jgi:Family of unknown function (DUF6714)
MKGRDKRKRAAQRMIPGEVSVGPRHEAQPPEETLGIAPQDSTKVGEVAGNPIVDQILSVFADTEYPGDDTLPWRSIEEEPEKFQYLMSRTWRDLELDKMASLADVLMWLSPEGLRYYLPAFLVAAVTPKQMPGSLDVIGFLAPPGRGESRQSSFRYFAKELTSVQKDAVRDCLRHLRINMAGIFAFWEHEGRR